VADGLRHPSHVINVSVGDDHPNGVQVGDESSLGSAHDSTT
jgi:hypothetical protein